jgi:hypothetical protein
MTSRFWNKLVLLILSVLLSYSCGNFALSEELGLANLNNIITLTPPSATVAIENDLVFSATGGTPPYTFFVSSGSGSIEPDTGVYIAASQGGTDIISVTDSLGVSTSVSVLVYVPGVLGISPSTITVVAYGSLTFVSAGGISPYEFSIIEGAGSFDLTTGFLVADSGPGVATVRVIDSETPPNTADATVTVSEGLGDILSLVPPAITLSTNDVYYFVSIGGTPPYSYDVISGSGDIDTASGKFTSSGSDGSATIRVTDSAIPAITDTSLVTTLEGLVIIPQIISVPANNNVAFAGSGGIPPYFYDVDSGGGTIDAGGLFTAPGSSGTTKVRITDNIGNFRLATIDITPPQPLNISPSSVILLVDNGFNFSAFGGTAPYTFTKVLGSGGMLPDGSYTAPADPGLDLIRVQDALGLTADGMVRIVEDGELNIKSRGEFNE